MEIERKFFINYPLPGYKEYPYHAIEQGYLCTEPVAVSYTHLLGNFSGKLIV